MRNFYLSRAVLACFDGEGDNAAAAAAAAAAASAGASAAASAGAAAASAGAGDGRFSQEDLNRILADDRRKHQQALQRAEKALEEVSTSKNLTIQEREQLAQQLEDMRKETRTKEAQLAHERKQLEEQYEKKLTDEKKARETWELRYREGTTERALLDAAVSGDAYDTDTHDGRVASHDPIVGNHRREDGQGHRQVRGQGRFPGHRSQHRGTDFGPAHAPIRREEDEGVAQVRQPLQVRRRQRRRGECGNRRPYAGQQRQVDPRKLSMEQYMAIRAKNPEQLGLRPPKKGQVRR